MIYQMSSYNHISMIYRILMEIYKLIYHNFYNFINHFYYLLYYYANINLEVIIKMKVRIIFE